MSWNKEVPRDGRQARPAPKRWDLDRLAKSGAKEDQALAEQGLADWADALDREDRS